MSLPETPDQRARGRAADGIRLGDWLVQRSLLKREQVELALQTCQLLGCRVGDAVVHLRLLDRSCVEVEVERREQYLAERRWAPPPPVTQALAARDLDEAADITELIRGPARRAAAIAIVVMVAGGLVGWLLVRGPREGEIGAAARGGPARAVATPAAPRRETAQPPRAVPAAQPAVAEEQKILERADAEARAGKHRRALELAMAALFALEERGARADPQAILSLARSFRRAPSSYRWQIDSLLIRAGRREDAPTELLLAAARVQRQRGNLSSAVQMLQRASAAAPDDGLVQRELRRTFAAQRAKQGRGKARISSGRPRRRS